MTNDHNELLIRKLWSLFSDQNWDDSKKLFHESFVAEWPQSKERFVGADNFVEMNRAYPGNHTIEIQEILVAGDRVVSAVYIHADTGQQAFATSFFEIKAGRIAKATEFWGEPYAAPESRKLWATAY